MKPITCFEIVDHGIDNAQYFQGCGVSRTKFTDVATGCGDTPSEALADALEQLATCGWDVARVEASSEGLAYINANKPSASDKVREQLVNQVEQGADESGDDYEERIDEALSDCDSELYYYLSVRVTDQTDWDETPEGFLDYRLPAPWAPYLINGDASGLDTGEKERIDDFIAAENLGSPVDCEQEASFSHFCDAPGEPAGDMLLFRFHAIAKAKGGAA